MQSTLSLRSIALSFQALPVLSDVSLMVKKGEFVSIIGPSGCGKSTLFRILSGIEDQAKGDITLEKKLIRNRRGKFGYMPQDAALLPWITVLENVMLGYTVLGKSAKTSREKALGLLEKFGLSEFSNYYPSALSGGMQQRVALLRTVLFRPEFLLLDEPFGSLDALTRYDAQLWLMRVCKAFNSSVLFITHDIQEAILLSDRIYVLSPRPAKVIAEVGVSLPRPRTLVSLTTPTAVTLEKKLLTLLTKK